MASTKPPSKNAMLKVLIIGDGGIGKSCLMNRFVSNHYDDSSFHTIGVEFLNKLIEVDGKKYSLQIWDTAGQERFRALRTPFYRGTDICLLCYAINDKSSFKNIRQWRDEFIRYADINPDNFAFIVVGNKNDLLDHDRQVSEEDLVKLCQEFNITSYIETSAKNSTNVYEAFTMGVRQWKKSEKITDRELNEHGDTIDLMKPVTLKNEKFCCFGSTSSNNPDRSALNDSETDSN